MWGTARITGNPYGRHAVLSVWKASMTNDGLCRSFNCAIGHFIFT